MTWMLNRRACLAGSLLALPTSPWAAPEPAPTGAGPGRPVLSRRLAMTWRDDDAQAAAAGPASPTAPGRHRAGFLRLDASAGRLRLEAAVDLPGRAHGLVALPDGGCLVVANRPGQWWLRLGPDGGSPAWHRLDTERPARTLNGHVEVDADGQWAWTSETDPASGAGWVSVRDTRTGRRVAQWPSQGIDPHQLLLDGDGGLLVAQGGIARWPDGRKRADEPLQAALVRLDARNGRLLGRWTLPDPALSIRHLAWAHPLAMASPPSRVWPLLGVALQAEHGRADDRRSAPLLALWDGQALQLAPPPADGPWQGYAGDIAAAPAGGFVLSGQKAHQALWWHPAAPQRWQPVAHWTDVCALAAADAEAWGTPGWADGVLVGGARGLALWHPRQPPLALAWPGRWAPDNHLVPLAEPA